jgi:hypothetical protein
MVSRRGCELVVGNASFTPRADQPSDLEDAATPRSSRGCQRWQRRAAACSRQVVEGEAAGGLSATLCRDFHEGSRDRLGAHYQPETSRSFHWLHCIAAGSSSQATAVSARHRTSGRTAAVRSSGAGEFTHCRQAAGKACRSRCCRYHAQAKRRAHLPAALDLRKLSFTRCLSDLVHRAAGLRPAR